MKWDAVVLTASDTAQKKAFELQLEVLSQLKNYAEKYLIFEDRPKDVKIGSGGSTILALNRLSEIYGDQFSTKKILLIHSGGLSQRLPVVSALGKVFLLLPGGKTMLEMKLCSYRPLLCAVSAGVVISASDTLEYIPSNIGSILPGEVTLFAHPSSINVAMQHGVYVLKDGSLETVLQKPTLEELKMSGALKTNEDVFELGKSYSKNEGDGDEHVLTDSFFFLTPKIALHLASLKVHEPFDCETCCYGDFLRALGTLPQTKYLEAKAPLGVWRQRFATVFRGLSCRVVVLPQNSFFHFGTPQELYEHLQPDSAFCRRFSTPSQQCLFSFIKPNSKIGEATFIEYCNFPEGVNIGSHSFISDFSSSHFVEIPSNIMGMSVVIRMEGSVLGYVTAIFDINDDLKKKNSVLKWFNKEVVSEESNSLWTAKLFKVCSTMEESLEATLQSVKMDHYCAGDISFSETLHRKDVVEMMNFRKVRMA